MFIDSVVPLYGLVVSRCDNSARREVASFVSNASMVCKFLSADQWNFLNEHLVSLGC